MTWKASPHDFYLINFHLLLCYINTFTHFYFLYFLPKLAFSKNGCFVLFSCPLCFYFFFYVIMTSQNLGRRAAEASLLEMRRIRNQIGGERQACLRWERRKAEREDERGGMVKLKILGIWVVLFVWICDCFVVNLLDWICSLSGRFLVCLV